MVKADELLGRLVSAAFSEQTDVVLQCHKPDYSVFFSDGVRTAVFFTGRIFPDSSYNVSGDTADFGFDVYEKKGNIIADIRVLGNEDFRNYLTMNNCRRLVIAFAECAEASEYGHRQEYLWVSEYRAEINHFCQLVLLFSQSFDEAEACFRLYGDGEAVYFGKRSLPGIRIYKCSSRQSKFYCIANELEKRAFGNHAVFFNSRNEASEFAAFLQKRNTPYVYVDGAVSSRDVRERLAVFSSGAVRVLIATKSGISLMPFVDVDNAVLCGMPFSVSHLGRLAAACRKESIRIIFSESDINRNSKILEYFRESDGDEELYRKRVRKLSEVSEIIIKELEKE